jgi:Tfp pilus assembly major pilin PilA
MNTEQLKAQIIKYEKRNTYLTKQIEKSQNIINKMIKTRPIDWQKINERVKTQIKQFEEIKNRKYDLIHLKSRLYDTLPPEI